MVMDLNNVYTIKYHENKFQAAMQNYKTQKIP